MNCEVVAIGTELLLGQIVDTNSSWIGEQLAMAGIDSHHQTKVGDNHARIVDALRLALSRSDAVICCGGLGPTQDDITRAAIAEVMGVELVRDPAVAEAIEAKFEARGRQMPQNNLLQAEVPVGARINPAHPGTAPGLMCPLSGEHDGKVIYAVPGVPWEMKSMMVEGVLPDLRDRAGLAGVIGSRVLRTWGLSESALAEKLDEEIRRLDTAGGATLAFLASGWNGMKVRITAKASTEEELAAILDDQEARVRAVIGNEIIFGVDDDTMESVVLDLLRERNLTLGLAESLTGGLIGSRLTGIPGASSVFRGAVVPYDRAVKQSVLGCPDIDEISEETASAMAAGACRVLGSDVALAVTGVAGPDPVGDHRPGHVWVAVNVSGHTYTALFELPGDRERVRQYTCVYSLDFLRRILLAESEHS